MQSVFSSWESILTDYDCFPRYTRLVPRDCYSFPRFTLLLPSVCNLHHAIFTYPRERITQFIITFAFFFYLYVFSEFSYFLFFPKFCKTEEKKSFSKENKVTFGKCIFHAPLFIHASTYTNGSVSITKIGTNK